MAKLVAKSLLLGPPKYGKAEVSVPVHLEPLIRTWPGSRKDTHRRTWHIDEAFLPGLGISWEYPTIPVTQLTQARPYQITGIQRAAERGRWIFNFEMGLGKTMACLMALKALDCKRVLVVCPAMVRSTWQDEFAKWWPEHGAVHLRCTGNEKWPGITTITSYELLEPRGVDLCDALVLDEIHYVGNFKAGRSQMVAQACDIMDDKPIFGLTGTAITNDPKTLWHQLQCLWPYRFGPDEWAFLKRYCNVDETRYGLDIHGLNEDNAEELRHRLTFCMHRVTTEDAGKWLPPLDVQAVRITNKVPTSYRELLADFTDSKMAHREKLMGDLCRAGAKKLEAVVDLVKETRAGGVDKIIVLCQFKDTAAELTELLLDADFEEAEMISGNIPADKRIARLKYLAQQPTACVVATMQSIEVGIDLTAFNNPIFAELNWRPATMTQVLKRFHRLSGNKPVLAKVVLLDGTLDEVILQSLQEKLKDINKVIKAGGAEEAIEKLTTDTDENFMEKLRAVASSRVKDEYL